MKKALPLGAKVGQWAVKKAIGVRAAVCVCVCVCVYYEGEPTSHRPNYFSSELSCSYCRGCAASPARPCLYRHFREHTSTRQYTQVLLE
jgi:hypothetical protein